MAYHSYYSSGRTEFSVPTIIQPMITPAVNGNPANKQTVASSSFNYHHLSPTATKAKSFNPSFSGSTFHPSPSMMASGAFDSESERSYNPAPTVKLENEDLWQVFHKHGTEMVITKAGRYIFSSETSELPLNSKNLLSFKSII